MRVNAFVSSFIGALLVSAPMVFGSGEKENAGSQTAGEQEAQTIRVLVRPDEGDIVADYTEQFEQETGHTVEVDFVGWDQIHDKILSVLLGGGAGYDVVFIPDANAMEFMPTGEFQPLNDMIPDEERDEWLTSVLEYYQYEGDQLGIPWYSGGAHMAYNEAYLNDAGVDPASIDTWEDFLEASRQVVDSGVVEYAYIPTANYPGAWHYNWGSMVVSMGGRFFDENMEPAFTSGAGVEALEILVEGVEEGVFDAAGVSMNDYEALKSFQAGDTAFMLNSTWSANQATLPDQSSVADDVGFMPIPGASEDAGGLVYAGAFGIMQSSDSKQAARAWIETITSEEAQFDHATKGANLPTRTALLTDPQRSQIADEWPIYPDLAEQVSRGRFGPRIAWLDPARRVFASMLQSALSGDRSPQEAVEWAAGEIRSLQEEQ